MGENYWWVWLFSFSTHALSRSIDSGFIKLFIGTKNLEQEVEASFFMAEF